MWSDSDPVLRLVGSLDYEWHDFGIAHFVQFVAQRIGRSVHLVEIPCDPSLSAFWIHGGSSEYIFVRNDAPHLLRVHSALHEIGHLLLGHHGLALSNDNIEVVLQSLTLTKHLIEDSQQERDAERFAVVIGMQINGAKRGLLNRHGTSIGGLRSIAASGF
jgi:hypothetical protein